MKTGTVLHGVGMQVQSVCKVKTNEMLGGLRTFFITFLHGYTVVLCLFDAIMRKAFFEY
jgi:hypothetical protein